LTAASAIKGKGWGYLALAATSILWGTTWVASKFALDIFPSALQVSYIRQFFAGSAFLLFFTFIKPQPFPSWSDFKVMFMMSILIFVIANGVSTWGLSYLPTGLAALIGALYPLSVIAIEWIFYGQRNLSLLTVLGSLAGLSGVAFVFYQNMFDRIDGKLIFGLVLSILAMWSWSLGTVLLSRRTIKVNPYYAMGWQMLMGAIMLYGFAHWLQKPTLYAEIKFEGWMAVGYLTVVGSIISFIAFIYSLKKLPPAISSLYAYINPIIAIITASVVLNEKLTISILLGTIVTMIGVYLVNYSVKKDRQKIITEAEI
jgi:drug/metabolite transporter (DMT)-like permease